MVAYIIEHQVQRSVSKFNGVYKDELPKITPHTFRHTFCKKCFDNGMNMDRVKYIMGHGSIEVTQDTYNDVYFNDVKPELARHLEEISESLPPTP